jgi:hypothetical protein
MTSSRSLLLVVLSLLPVLASAEPFEAAVGAVTVAPVKDKASLELPVLTWGGDVATFHANGGRSTAEGSIFKSLGLSLEVTSGDDFPKAVGRYLSGETPFLRGTMRMLGLASELCARDKRTEPVVFLQLTWSAGDHLVGREGIKTLSDLKGKKVAIQAGGPHLGLMDDALRAAQLGWGDIEVVWCKDLTGTPDSPAERFRADPSIAACTVISPDMSGLSGGDIHALGSGEGKSIKGSRVVVSTAQMSRSIADVYAVRRDYYEAHRDTVEKFAAGYLKACEELVGARKHYEKRAEKPADRLEARQRILGVQRYEKALGFAQEIFGKEAIPSVDDAHGLICDCSFVGLPGNNSFFNDAGNLAGFMNKAKAADDLAVGQTYAPKSAPLAKHDLDYKNLISVGKLEAKLEAVVAERFVDIDADALFGAEGKKTEENDRDTILSFTIYFDGNQYAFPVERYGANFQRAVEAASTFGNAIVAIAGHADLKWWLDTIQSEGQSGDARDPARKVLRRTARGWELDGASLDFDNTPELVRLSRAGAFGKKVVEGLDYLNDLSLKRASNVRKAILDYAAAKKFRLDPSQIKFVAVGVREPAVKQPKDLDDSKKNMRVEFRVIKVRTELPSSGDFDY